MAKKLDGHMTTAQIVKASGVKNPQVTNPPKALRDLRPQHLWQLGEVRRDQLHCRIESDKPTPMRPTITAAIAAKKVQQT